jgi:Fe-S cluster biogenesis protein NfuA
MSAPSAQKYVNIYTEANPNPNSLKFVLNDLLVEEGSDFDFPNQEAAEGKSPLAKALFTFYGIERVFIMNNFITLTKAPELDWHTTAPEIKAFIKKYIEEGNPIMASHVRMGDVINPDDSEVVKKIKGLLDEYVRPAVESDGGAITFRDFENGKVTVELRGSCSGCPSSTLTLKAGIENLLKRMLPADVTEVVAEGM